MKKRVRRGDSQRQSYWEEVVRRCGESGQSVRAFCRAEGLRESAFYFWRRKLARRDCRPGTGNGLRPQASQQPQASSATPASRSPRRMPSPHGSPPSFLPMHVVEGSVPEVAQGVEIVLGRGCTVRVQAGFDRQTLAEVLTVLEARPC